MHQVVYRNGSIWCAHTIGLPGPHEAVQPTRSAIQWWELSASGIVRQVGRIDDPTGVNFYAYPSITVNQFNDALLGFSSFSSNQYASASYAFRAYYDSLGDFRSPTLLKAGEGVYWASSSGRNRWGDYSAAQPDPLDDSSSWTIQQYAMPHAGTLTNLSGRWGTWWGQIAITNPPNNSFTNSITVTGVPNHTYVIQASVDLVAWAAVYTNVSSFNFNDTITTNYPIRFFRAVYGH